MQLGEIGQAVRTAHASLSVDDDRRNFQRADGLHHAGETVRPIVPAAREQPNALALAAGNQPVAVVLDLVNPVGSGRGFAPDSRQTGFDEAGRVQPPGGYARQHAGDAAGATRRVKLSEDVISALRCNS
jgi:CheY-like chemotaxis protein